eukprot:CAMPEP_0195132792 /NCGR_PEP_ID=MMETSP0448-20130528/147527_1 /TAXON_ID=66468 /ORGANISM="Heterocapsa triquestra, Strain CCMP 448" /LENGTH=100 /DNA_ID=CAMNT_0040170821 /DNA_START=3 /DNA_END=302 /DNA_ORIENTATION=+
MAEANARFAAARRERQQAVDAHLGAHWREVERARREKEARFDDKIAKVAQLEAERHEWSRMAERRRAETLLARDEIWDLLQQAATTNKHDERIRQRLEEL